MRKLLLIYAALFFALPTQAQNVTIPDANFRNYLLTNVAINTNSDAQISVAEAVAFAGNMQCPGQNIADLTGIEAFVNITEINVNNNNLTTLNFSSNVALGNIECGYNQLSSLNVGPCAALASLNCEANYLTTLNVSQNTNLAFLNCSQNPIAILNVLLNNSLSQLICNGLGITNLDLTYNPNLTLLVCHSNQLSSLVLDQNPQLQNLYCSANHLTSLDVSLNPNMKKIFCDRNALSYLNIANGNNSDLTELITHTNPNLSCIQVDNIAITASWTGINYQKDTWTGYSTACATSFNNVEKYNLDVYPNPCQEYINVTLPTKAMYKIIDWNGRTIIAGALEKGHNRIQTQALVPGIYSMLVQLKNGQYAVNKIVHN